MKQMRRAWLALALVLALPGTAFAAEATTPGGFLGAIDAVFASIVGALEIMRQVSVQPQLPMLLLVPMSQFARESSLSLNLSLTQLLLAT